MTRDGATLFRAALLVTAGTAVFALVWLAQFSGGVALALAIALVWAVSLTVDTILPDRKRRFDADTDVRPLMNLDEQALTIHAMVVKTDSGGRISFVNDRFLGLTGFDAADLIGKSPDTYGHPDDSDVRADVIEAHAAGDIWTGRQRIVGKSGQVFETQTTRIARRDDRQRTHGAITVHTDMSRQTVTSRSLDAGKSLHLLSEPVFIVSAQTHEVAFANDAAVALFGWDRDALSDVRMSDVTLARDRPAVMEQILALEAGQIDHFCFDALVNDVPFQGEIQLIEAADIGRRLYVVLRDQATEQAVSRAKDELVATVSHELRTPLTSIKGALGLIRSGSAGELSDKIVSLLDIAYRNADRLVLIVDDILDLEKLAAGQMDYDMECHDLVQTVRECVSSNESFATRFGVSIHFDAMTAPAWVIYDADRIHQVVTNLISNACKFSPKGSQIHVTVTVGDDVCQVRVADRGAGIPASAQERIFDRFTQVGKANRARKGGTGLGLSIVKGIVESHGGTVWLTSEEGLGTTVTVTFQRAQEPDMQWPAALAAEGGR
ncbi:PAS domain-containing sensor histidine kinase [Loktanella sp. DJP18]|uniref:PAS domain-containing sensor histidine kinase n=1 Tax=Loktanella sp. DJP18 TaxID=3409788 RepID=UPI003BB6B48C